MFRRFRHWLWLKLHPRSSHARWFEQQYLVYKFQQEEAEKHDAHTDFPR